jgi:hypothetical protein
LVGLWLRAAPHFGILGANPTRLALQLGVKIACDVPTNFAVLIALPINRENPAVNVIVAFFGRAFDSQIFLFRQKFFPGEKDSRLRCFHKFLSFDKCIIAFRAAQPEA